MARLVLGAGEGAVFTAGSAWIVDLAPPERRGRVIGLYGLAVWAGLSIGPLFGELIQLNAPATPLVWIFAGALPLLGALIAARLPDPFRPAPHARARAPLADRPRGGPPRRRPRPRLDRLRAVATFVVLHLDERGVGHGAPSSAPSRRWSC